MRLISCKVENFGILEDYSYNFNKGLNEIKRDNGSGKTTLASFIISMFYGMQSKKKDIANNDKVHYKPFQGGLFGGSIVFEYDGIEYQVDRDFDQKRDGFVLTEVATKRVVDKIGDTIVDETNLGETLFGINKESYKRSAFVPQDEIISNSVDGALSDRLRDIVLNTSESHNFDKALESIDKAVGTIEKARGSGKVAEINAKIKDIKTKIDTAKVCQKNIVKFKKELTTLDKSLQKVESQIKVLDDKIKEESKRELLLSQKRTYEEIKRDIEICKNQVAEILPFFKGQNIETIDLESIKSKVDTLSQNIERVKNLENELEREKLNIKSFNDKKVVQKELYQDRIVALENEKISLLSKKPDLENEIKEYKTKLEKRKSGGVVFGAFLLFLLAIIPGIIFVSVRSSGTKKIKEHIEKLQQDFNDSDNKLSERNNEIEKLTSQINAIENSAYEFPDRSNFIEQELEQSKKLRGELSEEIETIFDSFDCVARDFVSAYYEIDKRLTEYQRNNKDIITLVGKLTEFAKDKDIDALTSIAYSGVSIEDLQNQRDDKNEERSKLIEEISILRAEIISNSDTAAEVEDYEQELQHLEEERQYLVDQKELLEISKQYLQKANDSLAQKYLVPLTKNTDELVKSMGIDKSIELDIDGNLLVTEKGKDRKLDYFSKGIRELVSISMRLRLVDIIFGGDDIKKPCVILDDPFVNLDGSKLDEAKKYINKIANKYQIVYLTCHDSRLLAEQPAVVVKKSVTTKIPKL